MQDQIFLTFIESVDINCILIDRLIFESSEMLLIACKINSTIPLKANSRSNDLTIFKCFRVVFSLKKKTIKFPLSFNLYFL